MIGATIRQVRAFVVPAVAPIETDAYHWLDDHVATPMAKYPDYRQSRKSWGIHVIGTLVVEVEADDGTVGVGVTAGGEPGAWIVERHLARFLEGARAADIERIWDQMYLSTLNYGRRGIVLNVISAIDLALWDLLGKLRDEPVYQMLGGPVRDEVLFYATGPRPDVAERLGFIGGKLALRHGAAEGEAGLRQNIEALADARSKVSPDFWLMFDCWMSLDLDYALKLARESAELGLKWIEEALPPDDYWGYAALKKRVPPGVLVTTGEHEATRWGFRLLLEMQCADIIQPDVSWCGGITELLRISALADVHGVLVIPHGSSMFSNHYVITRHNSPFSEYLVASPRGETVLPMYGDLFVDEPLPLNGQTQAFGQARLRRHAQPGPATSSTVSALTRHKGMAAIQRRRRKKMKRERMARKQTCRRSRSLPCRRCSSPAGSAARRPRTRSSRSAWPSAATPAANG